MGDNDFVNNIRYTSDVHIPAGQQRWDLAAHLEKALVECSHNGCDSEDVDQDWLVRFQNHCQGRGVRVPGLVSTTATATGCKWCAQGDCWDHQVGVTKKAAKGSSAKSKQTGSGCKWCDIGQCWTHGAY